MNQTFFQDPAWYHAIMLTERMASLCVVQRKMLDAKVNAELSERRLQRWRSQAPFTSGSYFDQRLAIDGMNEDELRYLLGEPIEAVRSRFPAPPAWLAKLARAFFRPASSRSNLLPEVLPGQERTWFLNVIEPLIRQGCERLHAGVQALAQTRSNLPFDPGTVEAVLLANLSGQLIQMLSRALVLELNVVRLQGFLEGDTPEERFRSFLQRLRQREIALALLQEYPVLARQLTMRIDQWVGFSLEFLRHLGDDWEAIWTMFSSKHDPGVLVRVDGGRGDSHRGGRAVLIARFSSGFQVVYKPRSLTLDVHFQELLTWLNRHSDHPPFRTLKILNRDSYGWVEFVAAQSCTSVNEVQRFYECQGGYLALLYALEATDFHSENLIAAGEYPVLLDLEALFHPRMGGMDLKQADQLADSTLNDSVMRVGLLPQRIWSNAESEGIDISGLGKAAGQITPFGVPSWEGAGTDEMRFIRKRVAISGDQNRPTLNGNEVDVLDYMEAIAAGFTCIYRLLIKYHEELLSVNGPLAHFAEDEVRVILRGTQTYGLLLHESFHPDVLRNALDRDRLFDRLWVGVEYLPYLARVIPAERKDLLKGDIPMFTTRPGSCDLWSSSSERIADFFDEPSLTLVQRRLQQLSEDDLTRQLWFIRASLATLAMETDGAKWPPYHFTELHTVADRERLLAVAQKAGDRLEALALRGEHDVSWIGLMSSMGRHWSLVPLGTELYDGLAGIALFLAYLSVITREERYNAMAQDALTTMRRQVERSQSFITSIGGFSGWGGVIYTLTHLGTLWDQPALLAEAEALVERLPALIEQDELLDIIAGAAGCIGSLLSLYRCAPSDRTLAAAIQCGDRLITRAQTMEHGIGWTPKVGGTKPLTGFSRGAAGMAWALLVLASLTSEERFRTAAIKAIAYERSLFSPEAGNWPDLRELETSGQAANNGQARFMTAWCHGAPGIGLARLRSLPHLDDAETRAEIDAALKTTLTQGFGGNHSLCHGDLGNLELLLQASQVLDDPQWSAQVNRIAAMILESINRDGWLCGIPLGVESPGLMTGLAGIGYGLLRLVEPTRVPSVLVLEPPVLHM
jgi:type 2 lantibiotic biosynthesis protein LanM